MSSRKTKTLVIGSNGYLGINLTPLLHPENTVLISKSDNVPCNHEFNLIKADLTESIPEIEQSFDTIFLLSRPLTQDMDVLREFNKNSFDMVRKVGHDHTTIHVISSSLVYDSSNNVPLKWDTATTPVEAYERSKVELEQLFYELALDLSTCSVNIHRIPLLCGGRLKKSDRLNQILYQFYDCFREGAFWSFESDADKEYGTSYLDVSNFADWLINGNFNNGWNVWTPSSGTIRYYDYQKAAHRRLMFKPKRETIRLPKSYLFLENNTPIEAVEFWNCLAPDTHGHCT